jgi:hypothetical protein
VTVLTEVLNQHGVREWFDLPVTSFSSLWVTTICLNREHGTHFGLQLAFRREERWFLAKDMP